MRSRKKRSPVRQVWIIAISLIMAILYASVALKYKVTFLPKTVINGINVAGMDAAAVYEMINQNIRQYTLKIVKRDGSFDQIRGDEIGLSMKADGALEQLLEHQNPFAWGAHYLKGNEYSLEAVVTYDARQLQSVVNALTCLDPEQIISPVDAQIAYQNDIGYHIIAETDGNELLTEMLYDEIANAIDRFDEQLSLDELQLYKQPQIRHNDPDLEAQLKTLQAYSELVITYRFGDQLEILDGTTIHQWLFVDDQNQVIIQEAGVKEYIAGLAKKYNTAYHAKQLNTSYGQTVTITSGHYGWLINQEAEQAALIKIIHSGQSQNREPLYHQRAASHNSPDYGNTYVEINLTAQHLYFYKDGKLLIEADFVSGNESKNWSTPAGAFALTYKQRDATLRGKDYRTPVTYWMPFNGNIGMHDGYWRSSFGGTIYKKNGSHGCINLPPAAAKTIYENIEAGMPVLCYHLDGTEQKKKTEIPVPAAKPPVAPETSAAVTETAPAEPETVPIPTEAETAAVSETVAIPETIAPIEPIIVPELTIPESAAS